MMPEPSVQPALAGRMTAVMRAAVPQGKTALRVAVVRDGRFLEERLFREPTRISIGTSEHATLTLPPGDAPARVVVFEPARDGFALRTTEVSGRIAQGGALAEIAALRNDRRVALELGARGRLSFGTTTLLFQLVLLPPERPRAQLPTAVLRVGPIVDWPTTLIAALAFLLHFLAIGALYSDWVDPVVDDGVVVSAVVDSLRAPPAPPPLETASDETTPSEQTASPESDRPATKGQDVGRGPASSATQDDARLVAELDAISMGVLGALGAEGPATRDVIGDGEIPTGALDDAAARESGVSGPGQLALAPGGHTLRPGERAGSLRDLGNRQRVRTDDRGQVVAVKGPVAHTDVLPPNTTGRVDDAARVVAGMRPGFRHCYQRALDGYPDAQGSIRLSIQVGPNGDVAGVGASPSGNIPGTLVSCVTGRARAAQFAAPEGGSAVVNVPVIFRNQR
jgi:hypothetical protein